jgi:dGTPase
MNEDAINKIKIKYHDTIQSIDSLYTRQHSDDSRSRTDGEFQRDYTRIMYSSSFRRLQGKMQLLGIKNDQFFRNRLTHSLEVAQIARSIATKIGYSTIDTYVVEAGALAHDLGNPPFGHYGERVLNEICREVGGYEGNAQTLRILTTIEKKRPEFRGLNLTFRTLLSITKYFNKFNYEIPIEDKGYNKQKFLYDDDYMLIKKFIELNEIKIRTLDVQIVDISDEIAYAAHDLEDGLRQKLFTIDEIMHDYKAQYGESQSYKKLEEIVTSCRDKASFGYSKINSTEYMKLFRKELASSIIYTLIHDLDLVKVDNKQRKKTGTACQEELGFSTYKELAAGLKELTFKCINHNDDVYYYEQMGGKTIKGLFQLFMEHTLFLPPEYRAEDVLARYNMEDNKDKLQMRLTADYIAGMMDSYATTTYKKYFGEKSLDSIYK